MARKQHRPSQRARGSQGTRPIVAIVGRPNVGKSALFNRLTGSQLAIVEDVPGVTRDRLYADASAFGRDYVLIDTGGFDPASDDPMTLNIAAQVRLALTEADLVICVFDGSVGPLPPDREALNLLRRAEIPVLYVANKVDNPERGHQAMELYSLGLDRLLEVSALHGHGIGDLEELLAAQLPEAPEGEPETNEDIPRIAIIGQPNAGKSSLINRLLGEARQMVDDRPGTTVDTVDTLFDAEGSPLVLIDTAGIRRKRTVESGVEALSVMQAVRALDRAHTVVLMIDAERGPGEQDTRLAGLAMERGRALMIVLNKMDLLDLAGRKKAMQVTRDAFASMNWAPLVTVSVKSGRGVNKLLQTAREITANHRKRATTGELNRFFDEVLAHHPPPGAGGRAIRIYYVTQAQSRPPTFVVSSNYPDKVHFSYQRFLVNQLRERFGFQGTPINVLYRQRGEK
jgi:GTP-binding protein